MDLHSSDAQSLAMIDFEIGDHSLSPAEYVIVRQAIFATADFDYRHLVKFSAQALPTGAAAMAARTPVIVDVPMVQAAIATRTLRMFANPIYCCSEVASRPQDERPPVVLGMETLARRYPEAIFVVGESAVALGALLHLVESEEVKPALVIATPAGFIDVDVLKDHLHGSLVPHIHVAGRKGSAVVAGAIFNAILDLAWQAYGIEELVME
ncbi:MAG: precorrin-8X methylmutase [Oscillatoriales cyanobacterium SM2_2_1]|nr:precorrin-8X methylmutase [Oscillatoriales cyanobacterium SM2_2_1]